MDNTELSSIRVIDTPEQRRENEIEKITWKNKGWQKNFAYTGCFKKTKQNKHEEAHARTHNSLTVEN